jgi:hypothetical protein
MPRPIATATSIPMFPKHGTFSRCDPVASTASPALESWERAFPNYKESHLGCVDHRSYPPRRNITSCYFRHLKHIFEEAGIEVTKENKKEIDRVIHGLVKVPYKDCSPTWKAVKEQISGDTEARNQFIEGLKRGLKL